MSVAGRHPATARAVKEEDKVRTLDPEKGSDSAGSGAVVGGGAWPGLGDTAGCRHATGPQTGSGPAAYWAAWELRKAFTRLNGWERIEEVHLVACDPSLGDAAPARCQARAGGLWAGQQQITRS